jgi:pimeloyl-ACP methyl ester carboxylesterase
MPTWQAGDIESNGITLHYTRTGGRKPPVVLLHGFSDDGLCWTPVAEQLERQYDVIMVDARGHGKSEAPADGYTLTNLGAELAGLIQAIGLEKPFVLGHSMGAITALVLAGLFPDLPRAILLEDPPAFWMSSEGQPRNDEFLQGFMGWLNSNKRKTRDDLLADGRAQNPDWSEAELGPWADSKHRYSLSIAGLMNPSDLVSIGFPKLLQQITCPTLFIAADPARGAASGEKDIAKIKEYIPHLQVVPIANAGHNIRREQFKRYLEVVQQFLASVTVA